MLQWNKNVAYMKYNNRMNTNMIVNISQRFKALLLKKKILGT